MNKRSLLILFSLFFILTFAGCGSLVVRVAGSKDYFFSTPPYCGLTGDALFMAIILDEDGPSRYVMAPLLVIDVPLSLALDTILLPGDLIAGGLGQKEECLKLNFGL